MFEGEYLNGMRNGKGKEYYGNGKLRYEGEYLKGKINGKGREYDFNGKLKFEGEYLYGKIWDGFIYYQDNDGEYDENIKGETFYKY